MEKVWNSCCGERQLGIWQSQIPAGEAGAGELEGVAGAAVSVLGALQCLASPPTFCSVEAETANRQCCDPGLEIGPDSLVWYKRLL